jgi:hypothetical protein
VSSTRAILEVGLANTAPLSEQAAALEVEALIEEARRRRRRRRQRIAGVLVVLGGAVLGIVAGVGGAGGSGANRRVADGGVGSLLRGADTTLLMWPAGPPVFGDLPGGGPGTTVDVANLRTGRVLRRRIPGIAGGDFEYAILPVGRWLVYDSDSGVAAVRSDLAGSPRVLGSASGFVPSARQGSVWLVGQNGSGTAMNVRSVSVASGSIGPTVRLPNGTGFLAGTVRGLLLISRGSALELWRPGHTRTSVVRGVAVVAANARLVAFGSTCRWKEAMSPKGAAGYQVCATLHVIELRNGRRRSFAAPRGTLGWVPGLVVFDSLETAIAPNDKMLAARAATSPAGAGRAQLFVVHVGDGRPPTPVPDSTAPLFARYAWSIHGSTLLYQGPGTQLRAFRPNTAAQSQLLGMRCCQYADVVSIPTPSR